jgi:hypothetical protein
MPTLPYMPLWLLSGRGLKIVPNTADSMRRAGLFGDGYAQGVETHFTRMVRSVQGQQAGLETDEGEGVMRAYRAAEHASAVGVHAAGNVDREHAAAGCIDQFNECGITALERTLQPDAEQSVDDQVPVPAGWNGFVHCAAGGLPAGQRGFSIRGKLRFDSGEHDRNIEPPLLEMAGGDQCISAVVAGASE